MVCIAMSGYVYVLKNSTLPEMYKIGGTTKHPEVRAKELSNTSIPTPYEVCFSLEVADWRKSESFIHESLSAYRVANNREFFSCPLEMIELQFDKLQKLDNPLNFLIHSSKGGSCSTTVAFGLAAYYKEKGYSVRVSEPTSEERFDDTGSLASTYGYICSNPQVNIRVSPSYRTNKAINALNWAIENNARVIIPTLVGINDLDVLYSDILDFKKTKIKPYVLFSCVRYFPGEAEKISQAIITSRSLGATVLPYTIPHSEMFTDGLALDTNDIENKVNPYSRFNIIFEGVTSYFEYEDYESSEE